MHSSLTITADGWREPPNAIALQQHDVGQDEIQAAYDSLQGVEAGGMATAEFRARVVVVVGLMYVLR